MSTPADSTDPNLSAAAMAEHDALAPGTRLGELEVLRILGVGGFGIVYLARDHSLERDVALKEYMPASLAKRGDNAQITVRSASFVDTYAIGLRSFINEAKLLARFDHPSLVKVYRFWEGNGTAYMVMPYLQGHTLRDVRRTMTQPPSEAWIRGVLERVLGALEVMHREGVYHRDIAPDNILITPQGLPILLDFGAARRVISDRTQTLTAILKPSYAPIEQYAEMTQMRQGPWTDLYALGAVVQFLLKGVPPMPATARLVQDEQTLPDSAASLGVSPRFLTVIDWAMALRPQDRPQDVEALRSALEGRTEPPPTPRQGVTVPGHTSLMPVRGTGATAPYEATLQITPVGQPRPAPQPAFVPTQRVSAPTPRPEPPQAVATQAGVERHASSVSAPPAPAAKRNGLLPALVVGAVVVGGAAVWALVGGRSDPARASAGTSAASGVQAVASPPGVAASTLLPSTSGVAETAAPASLATSPAAPSATTTVTTQPTAPDPTTATALPAVPITPPITPPITAPATEPVAAVRPSPLTPPRPKRTTPAQALPVAADDSEPPRPSPVPTTSPPSMAPPVAEVPARPPDSDDEPDAPRAQRPALAMTARQACGHVGPMGLLACMQIQCRRPRFASDLECIRINSARRLGDPP